MSDDFDWESLFAPDHYTRAGNFLTAVNILNATHGGVGNTIEPRETETDQPLLSIFTELNDAMLINGLTSMIAKYRASGGYGNYLGEVTYAKKVDQMDIITAERTTASVFITGPDYDEVVVVLEDIRNLTKRYGGKLVAKVGEDEIEITQYNVDFFHQIITEDDGGVICHHVTVRVLFE